MSLQFIRHRENFCCDKCGYEVLGNGYTNHCPECLWSKHVDVNPGDRLASCQALMEPVAVEIEKGDYEIIHRCLACGYQKRNKSDPNDKIGNFLAGLL